MKTFRFVIAALAILSTAIGAAASAGTFKDRDGASHPWSINETHAVVWEGRSYIPFGVLFEPKYLTSGQTEENWAADEQQVAAFKTAGVRDVMLVPSKGVASVAVEAFQRIIDLLETNGLRYGIELYDPPYAPLSGYVVEPAVNRVEGVHESGDVTRSFPDARSALYVICHAKTGAIGDRGRVAAVNGDVTVPARVVAGTDNVVLFYPERVIACGSADWCLPDVWSDYDRHRDRLVWHLSQVKWGKGLRFFADPFTRSLGVRGDVDALIPSSTAFRVQYSVWLSQRYGTPRDLGVSWGVTKHDVDSFEEAARLVPLWRNGRGAAAVHDSETARTYVADVTKSNIWVDFLQFRAYSVRGYMDTMGDALKRLCADVPVVYTATGLQGIFQTSGAVGYDGLAVSGSGGQALVSRAGEVFSLVEHSDRKMWIVSRLEPSEMGYQKKEDLFRPLNALHDLGAKGFFVGLSRETGVGGADLLAWLAEYSSLSAGDTHFASYLPRAIYYPNAATGANVARLSGGAWWLPALAAGRDLYLGSTLAGYTLVDRESGGVDIHVWSLEGEKTITLLASDTVTLISPSGDATEVKPRKGKAKLTVGEEPTLIRGIAAESFVPVEVAVEAIEALEDAIARAEEKNLDTTVSKHQLRRARELLKNNQLPVCLDMARITADEINLRLKDLESRPPAAPSVPEAGGGAQ